MRTHHLLLALIFCIQLPMQCALPEKSHEKATSGLERFLILMSNVRNATPSSGLAKADAIALFTRIYTETNHKTQEALTAFVGQLSTILKRRITTTNNKEKLCLLLFNKTRIALEPLLKQQGITAKIKKLFAKIHTAIQPVLGDFWRKVRMAALITTLAAAAGYTGYKLHRLHKIMESEDSAFNRFIQLLSALHSKKDAHGESEFVRFMAAATKNLESTEDGSFTKLMTLLTEIKEENPELITELATAITKNLNDPNIGTFAMFMEFIHRILDSRVARLVI